MSERRLHQRFQKPYTIIFSLKDNPRQTYDMSMVLDISRGGLSFTSSVPYPPGTKMIFNITFSFLYPQATIIDGEVVATEHRPKATLFKMKVKFINMSPLVESILWQMEQCNLKNK